MAEVSSSTSVALTLGVKAGIYPIKIVSIEAYIVSAGGILTITEYAAATLSAGSAITPYPLRFGAPAASSTARSGAPTGTSTLLRTSGNAPPVGPYLYTPPSSLILPAGAALGVAHTGGTYFVIVVFDELEIQPGY